MKRGKWLPVIFLCLILSCRSSAPLRSSSSRSSWDGSGTRRIDLDTGGYERSALLHIPDCEPPAAGWALVIVFHGGGGTAAGINWEASWSAKADQECFLALFPDGLARDPSRKSRFIGNPQTWNDGSERFNQDVNDVGFISSLIKLMENNLAVNSNGIFVTGFSNGASMAYRTAAELSSQIEAAAPVSGALWLDELDLQSPVSLLYISGTDDPLNPISGGQPRTLLGRNEIGGSTEKPPLDKQIEIWRQALHCREQVLESKPQPEIQIFEYQHCQNAAEVKVILLEGHGHHWPGGKSLLPEFLVGPKRETLNATAEIWKFFNSR